MILAASHHPGPDPTVVLVHGLGGSRRYWSAVVPVLATSHAVLAVDLRGHGASDMPEGAWTVADMADDVAATVEAAGRDLSACCLVGHSMGTCVVADLAAARDVGSVVLTGALPKVAEAGRPGFEARAVAAREGRFQDVAELVVAGAFTAAARAGPDPRPGLLADALAGNRPEAYARACDALLAYDGAPLEAIGCPTLYLVGTEDPGTPPAVSKEMAARTKGAAVREVPGAAHWSALERPETIAGAILGWLAALGVVDR